MKKSGLKKQLFFLPCRPYFLTNRLKTRCQRKDVVEKGTMKDKARIVFSYRFSVRGPNYQVLHELRLQQCLWESFWIAILRPHCRVSNFQDKGFQGKQCNTFGIILFGSAAKSGGEKSESCCAKLYLLQHLGVNVKLRGMLEWLAHSVGGLL